MTRSTGKKLFARLLTALLAIVLIFSIPGTATAATTENLSAAGTKYGVSSNCIITAKTPDAIKNALQKAGGKATASRPYIVYAPSGSYAMKVKLTVPDNVIFVAETDSVFTASSSITQFFTVRGSLYGGTYDGKSQAYYCLRLENQSFSGKNGYISNTVVRNSKRAGIVAVGSKCKNGFIQNNNVSGCGNSGISAVEGAWLNTVSGNTCSNNTLAGINLGHSNIDVISNNTLTGNTGHGISTDSDGKGQGYCHIHKIMGNTIRNNKVNGVYIDGKCYVDVVFSRNKISGNLNNGLVIDEYAYVKAIAKNTFSGQGASNLRVTGKNANAYLGNKNTLASAGSNNITVDKKGRVTISGTGNVIKDSLGNGVSVNGASTFRATGKNTKIQSNKSFGIRVDGKSTIKLKNVTFSNNGSWAVKVYRGSKATYSNTNLSTANKAKNRIYIQ